MEDFFEIYIDSDIGLSPQGGSEIAITAASGATGPQGEFIIGRRPAGVKGESPFHPDDKGFFSLHEGLPGGGARDPGYPVVGRCHCYRGFFCTKVRIDRKSVV